MDTFIKADIFFFVTTTAIVLLTTLFAVLLLYMIRAMRNIYIVSRDVKKEIDSIVYVIRSVRMFAEEKGALFAGFFSRFMPHFGSSQKKSPKTKSTTKRSAAKKPQKS